MEKITYSENIKCYRWIFFKLKEIIIMSYLTVLFLFFVILAIVTDLSKGDNLETIKAYLKDYFIKDTVLDTEEAEAIVIFSKNIFSAFAATFIYNLPVNNFKWILSDNFTKDFYVLGIFPEPQDDNFQCSWRNIRLYTQKNGHH